jgi:hypothetical protein
LAGLPEIPSNTVSQVLVFKDYGTDIIQSSKPLVYYVGKVEDTVQLSGETSAICIDPESGMTKKESPCIMLSVGSREITNALEDLLDNQIVLMNNYTRETVTPNDPAFRRRNSTSTMSTMSLLAPPYKLSLELTRDWCIQ